MFTAKYKTSKELKGFSLAERTHLAVNTRSAGLYAVLPKRSNGADCKSADIRLRVFESLTLQNDERGIIIDCTGTLAGRFSDKNKKLITDGYRASIIYTVREAVTV